MMDWNDFSSDVLGATVGMTQAFTSRGTPENVTYVTNTPPPEDDEPNYTVWIAGGVGILVLLLAMVLIIKK